MLSALVERIAPRLRRVLTLLVALAMMGLPLYVLPPRPAGPQGSAVVRNAEEIRTAGSPRVEEFNDRRTGETDGTRHVESDVGDTHLVRGRELGDDRPNAG